MKRTFYGLSTFLTVAAAAPAQEWFRLDPEASPAARRFHSVAYDGARRVVVMFGGADEKLGKVYGDTWELDGVEWKPRQLAGPSPRSRHAACYDTVRGRVLVFGGVDVHGKPLNDTWAFDGKAWTEIKAGSAPSPRSSVAIAFDRARGRAVLFGGRDAAGQRLGDTWELDGASWILRTPTTAPAARHGHAMTFDSARGVTVLVGGFAEDNRTNVETFEWDGKAWTQKTTANAPSTMIFPALTYNPYHGVAVLVGEVGGAGTPIKTFAFDGTDWYTGPTAPRELFGRQAPGLAFDEARDAAVLFGGASISRSALPHADTWKLSTPAVFETFGAGCATSAGVPTLSAAQPPRLGTTFRVDLSPVGSAAAVLVLGDSDQRFGPILLPLDLATLGMPGCPLLVSIDQAHAMKSAGGTASFALPIALDPQLLGLTLFAQGFLHGRERATSNGARLVVGN